MDYEHIYVLFTDRDGVTDSELKEFDDLPYKHKAVLVHMPSKLKSAQYIRGYRRDKEIGMLIKNKSFWSYHMKYDDFDYIKWFNT